MLSAKKHIVFLLSLALFFSYASLGFANEDSGDRGRKHYLKGSVYYQQGRFDEAEVEFKLAYDLLHPKEEKKPYVAEAPVKEDTPKALAIEDKQAQLKKDVRIKASGAFGSGEYMVGEDDTLHISVWQNPDLEQEVVVRPDGKISFPLIGDIQASGLTITQLDDILTEKLVEYIKHPEVSVSVKRLGGKKVIVLGEVRTPGIYSVTGKRTILESIAMAGGFTNHAVVSSVILVRGGLEKPKGIRLNLNRSLIKGDMSQNMSLFPEDIIFVPKKFIANVNYLVNEIVGPIAQGSYNTDSLYNKRW